jgi:iron complex transport system substrate-binding protein
MKITRCPKVRPAMAVVAAALLMMMGVAAGCGPGAGGTSTSDAIQGAEATQTGRSTVTLTDQAGRTVTVPNPIKSVYCTSPMGTNLMYMLAPDMLVGWNISPTALEKQYIPEQYRSVVGLGGWFGKNTTGNVEETGVW